VAGVFRAWGPIGSVLFHQMCVCGPALLPVKRLARFQVFGENIGASPFGVAWLECPRTKELLLPDHDASDSVLRSKPSQTQLSLALFAHFPFSWNLRHDGGVLPEVT
jgi:hypothetical protein